MLSVKAMLISALITGCLADPAKWCCTSIDEYRKCLRLAYDSKVFRQAFRCIRFDNEEECALAIGAGEADVMFLDGGEIFRHKESLVVVASEDYGDGDASYYAVAAVKKYPLSTWSMLSLNGSKSCHTSIGKSAGWNTPMGWLARHHDTFDENGKLTLFDPFSASCAPGGNDPAYIHLLPDPTRSEKWCQLCIGDKYGYNVCKRDKVERYYGYNGAFQCLKDGAGDVAFIKHVIIPPAERDDFELLCKDGSRAHPDDWRNCHLAKIPAHGMVMKLGTASGVAEFLLGALRQAQITVNATDFFDKGKRDENLMWKSITKSFLGPYMKTPREHLGDDYYCNMMALYKPEVPDDCL